VPFAAGDLLASASDRRASSAAPHTSSVKLKVSWTKEQLHYAPDFQYYKPPRLRARVACSPAASVPRTSRAPANCSRCQSFQVDAIKAASVSADANEPKTPKHPCPCCGGHMIIIERFQRMRRVRFVAPALTR
jgi:hypothetical protein